MIATHAELIQARITLLQARVREEESFIALIDETVRKHGPSVSLGILRDDLAARIDMISVEIERLKKGDTK